MDTLFLSPHPDDSQRKARIYQNRYGSRSQYHPGDGFKCSHCHAYVHTIPMISGVHNRNHCPYCLWSRHLDLHHAGDRLSACKAVMEPIGLTVKPGRNKYGIKVTGELMLIHRCRECHELSINRIAADDIVEILIYILQHSDNIDSFTRNQLTTEGIHLLLPEDAHLVTVQLYGIHKI